MRPVCRSCTVVAVVLLLALALGGCHPKQQTTESTPSANELFDRGLDRLKKKDYDKAIEAFQRISLEYANTRYAADAQFYLAEAYVAKKDFLQASLEYEFLTTNYPTSPFYEEASFKTALCYFSQAPKPSLDQTDLKKTRDALELFKERFPDSRFLPKADSLEAEIGTRFARKEHDAGLLYARAGEYASARIYFLYVLENYPKASIVPEANYWLAVCYENGDAKDRARAIYEELSSGDYDAKLKKQAAERLAKLK